MLLKHGIILFKKILKKLEMQTPNFSALDVTGKEKMVLFWERTYSLNLCPNYPGMKGFFHLNRSGSMHLLFYMKPEAFTSCHFAGKVFYLLHAAIRRSLCSTECFLFMSVSRGRSVHLLPSKNGLMIQKCINFECPQSGTWEMWPWLQ